MLNGAPSGALFLLSVVCCLLSVVCCLLSVKVIRLQLFTKEFNFISFV